MTQLHAREKPPLSLDRHGNLILPAKVEKKVELPKPKAKAPAKKKAASKKKAKK
jgi:hypothetical protein